MKGSTLAQHYVDQLWCAEALLREAQQASDADEERAYITAAIDFIEQVLAEA